MKKRVFSALLALVLTLSAVVLPASAAGSFSDVSDKKTAQNVEVLRLLGVVEGNGIGQFNPYAQLTRAEFCKMLVTLMGSSDVLRYKTVTIFPDVRASHWAARYVNYAVRGEKLLAGLPDGTFQPDRAISYGEAVTILMRLLRTDADAASGGIWPEGYIDLAKAYGVSAGVELAGGAAISRAQAAQLFVNVLGAKATSSSTDKDGETSTTTGVYNPANCVSRERVTLIALNGNTARVSGGKKNSYDLVRPSSATVLNGLKGDLLLDADGKVLTFVPVVSSTTGAAVSNAAVILSADKSTVGISALTGGRTDFAVYRNGVLSSVSALRRNDVVTYDASSNTLYACDTRVAVYYEACDPSPSAPSSITVLNGTQFTVLPTAQESLSKFKPGKTMTLLLTSDGSVAGAVDSENSARANAVGVVDSNGKLQMFCGSSIIEIAGTYSEYSGKLVGISASKDKQVSLSAKSGGASGNLDVREGTLGSRKLADNALIYVDGELKSLSELTEVIIPQSQIIYARTNSSGQIDLIALSGTAINNTIVYGRVKEVLENQTEGTVSGRKITIECGKGNDVSYLTGFTASVGNFVEIIEGKNEVSEKIISSLTVLTKFRNVQTSAWVGTTAINYGGSTYNVPSGVLIWNRDGQSWFTGGVDAAISYGGTMTLYVKDGIVRAIEIGG